MRLLLMLLYLVSSVAWAAPSVGAPDTGAMDEMLRTFENAAGRWPDIIIPLTKDLFWLLVTISWVWSFGMMLLKGADLKEIIAELAKRTILIGFFWYLLLYGHELGAIIVKSFTYIGAQLAGTAAPQATLSPSSIFDIGLSLVSKIMKKLDVFELADSIGYILVALGVIVIFAFIVLNLMVVIIQYYFFLNAGVVMLGFLGHEWSREYGINYFKLMIGLGVKYLTMQLIIVLTLNIANGWIQQSDLTWTQLLIILPTMIVIWGLVREVPQMAQSLVSGSDQTTGNAVAGAMQAAAMVAAAAAGAYGSMGGFGGMAGGATQGAGNLSRLASAAWDAASGGGEGPGGGEGLGGGEADPATSPPPDAGADSSPAGPIDGGGSDIQSASAAGEAGGTSDTGNQTAKAATESAQENSSPPGQGGGGENSNGNGSHSASAPRSLMGTAAAAAGIAGAALGQQLKGSAVNAFKAGMNNAKARFNTPSNSAISRAAASLKPNDPAFQTPAQQEGSIEAAKQADQPGKSNKAPGAGSNKPAPWMQQSGGFSALSQTDKTQALKNYSQWIEDPKHTFGLEEYVSFTQGKNQQ